MVLSLTTLVARRDQRGEFVKAGLLAVERVRAEPGCAGCWFFHDVGSDGTFVVVEKWDSMAVLRQYLCGEAYRRMLALMEMSECSCDVAFHAIRRTTGMELVYETLARADESP
jgi:quinol monooxygenase YgiN